jgi:hypothetical protein
MKGKIVRTLCFLLVFVLLVTGAACTQSGEEEPKETEQTTERETTTPVMTTTEKQTENQKPVVPEEPTIPISSVFYSERILDTIRRNSTELLEFKAAKQTAVNAAQKYMEMSYDELWGLIFGPELERSWMVKSDGICPECRKPVLMYDWVINVNEHPWKLKCPKCNSLFPKNDFYAYYQSGLDKSGRFNPELADKSLLYNEESGDTKDTFGVDDGTGYKEGDQVYRFIATYLIKGQWKLVILEAIRYLSSAYTFTGDTEYGVRALILLDRLADFWPEYDYWTQGWMYEILQSNQGYISYNIDSAFEVYDLAMAYDKVVEVLYKDPRVCEFLSQKAEQTGNPNKKKTPEEVKKNIDDRFLKDTIANPQKYRSNPPYTELALFTARAVLDWETEKGKLYDEIADIITLNTKYDGMTGESGLNGYATMGKHAIALMCNLFYQADPDFIEKMYERCPKLYDAYRFHIDMYCVNRYFPVLGDVGYFGSTSGIYVNSEGLQNLMLYKLYKLTGDTDLIKILFNTNGRRAQHAFKNFVYLEGIPEITKEIDEIIKEEGSEIELGSVRKDEYQMAVLRTGGGQERTEVWINFGTNKTSHDHSDGMVYGIYLMDADMMPDNGYPNVAYGDGWRSDVVKWNRAVQAHNTITFNNMNHSRTDGVATLWSIGDIAKVIRANAPNTFPGVKKFERSLALVNISKNNTYIVDVFCVGDGPAGTYEKFSRSNIGDLTVSGLTLKETQREYPEYVYMENFQESVETQEVWTADWAIVNVLNQIAYGTKMHLKMIDLTRDENVILCDTWLPPSMAMKSQGHEGFMLPTVITERSVKEGETATFVSVMEPYSRDKSYVQSAKRYSCITLEDGKEYDSNAAIAVETIDGYTDVLVLLDPDLKVKEDVSIETEFGAVETDSDFCLLRFDAEKNLVLIRASKGTYVKLGDNEYTVEDKDDMTSYDF